MSLKICFLLGLLVSNAHARPWWGDRDGDTYGNPRIRVEAAAAPAGYVGRAGDCNDRDATVNRGAAEIWYDGVDQNCDRRSDYDQDGDGADEVTYPGGTDCDDADSTFVTYTWYQDTDGDGYGDPVYFTEACTQPAGYVADSTDCNDYTTWISPSAFEYCDGEDNDCNGVIDDGDADGDGSISLDCGGDDCDDADPNEYPGAPEYPNWVDDNCSGTVDETCDWSCGGANDYDHNGVLDCSDDWDWWYAYGGDVSYMGTCTL